MHATAASKRAKDASNILTTYTKMYLRFLQVAEASDKQWVVSSRLG
jgi:hypothetical protein